MVRKLFKHECIAHLRVWLPVNLILLAVALFGKIIQFFESDQIIYDTAISSSVTIYIVAIYVAVGFTSLFPLIRYYKNLFSGEGYLSFSLPVTPSQHIFVKLLGALVFSVATTVAIILSLCIITSGDLLLEICRAAEYIIRQVVRELKVHFWLYLLELLVLSVVASSASYMFYYTCITIGQTAKKHRIGAAIGVYFIFYIVTQVISSILLVFAAIIPEETWESWGKAFADNYRASIHILFGVLIVGCLLYAAIMFLVSRTIIAKKLNLE